MPERISSPRALVGFGGLVKANMSKKDEGAVGPRKRNYHVRCWGRARVAQTAQGLSAAPHPGHPCHQPEAQAFRSPCRAAAHAWQNAVPLRKADALHPPGRSARGHQRRCWQSRGWSRLMTRLLPAPGRNPAAMSGWIEDVIVYGALESAHKASKLTDWKGNVAEAAGGRVT